MSNKKDMMTFEECIKVMNQKELADAPTNQCEMVDFNKDGKIPWGVRYKVSDSEFGVLAGKSLNPLIYRGENMEYEKFLPSAKRKEYTKLDKMKKEIFISLYKETPYYKFAKGYIDEFGYHIKIDLEAIAQHYGFKTNYLDVTRSRYIAEFFAYTYYDKGCYHPIINFDRYSPCVYTADLHEIYEHKSDILKLISAQIALRPCLQFAMAINIVDELDIKAMFKKELLPKDSNKARDVYDNLYRTLFPEQDVLNKISQKILVENKKEKLNMVDFFTNIDKSTKSENNMLEYENEKIMKENVKSFFKPLLESTGYRGCVTALQC